MSGILTLPSPGKLNLFLHILGRRDDGYHRLQTLFQLLEFGDSMTIHAAEQANDAGGTIETRPRVIEVTGNFEGLDQEDNLIYRAAKLLRERHGDRFDARQGARIEVAKRIPTGGGLGGGSSNAATALLGLNRLWEIGLDIEQLAALGAELGADVPVFVRGRSAFGEGIGELLTPVELGPRWYLVVVPETRVSTARIFAAEGLTRDSSPITIARFLTHGAGNDCEAVARELYPEVDQAMIWLRQRAPARMTGTGACVFAEFDSAQAAAAVKAQLPPEWLGFVTQGVDHSPLHRALAQLPV